MQLSYSLHTVLANLISLEFICGGIFQGEKSLCGEESFRGKFYTGEFSGIQILFIFSCFCLTAQFHMWKNYSRVIVWGEFSVEWKLFGGNFLGGYFRWGEPSAERYF